MVKIQDDWSWPYLSTGLNQIRAQQDHLENILDKFWNNMKSGLGGDAITKLLVLSKGEIAISKMAVWQPY